MKKLKEELISVIRDSRKRKNGCSYSFGEIGFMLFEIVKECLDIVRNEESD